MKLINCLIIFVCILTSCKKSTSKNTIQVKKISSIYVDKKELKLDNLKGQWYYNQKPFNGFAVTYHKNDTLSEKIGYYNGRKEGLAFQFFKNGDTLKKAFYIANKLHGKKLNYFQSGNLISESNYVKGKRHGEQKIWYDNGQLAKKKHLNMGKEDGIQQAWLKNGDIYVNYQAVNGRIFGLNRSNLCYTLKNEKIEYAKK